MPTDGEAKPIGDIPRRVIVKFHDAVVLPYEDGAERHVIRLGIGPWTELAHRFKGIRLDRLITFVSPERIGELVAQATDRDRHYRAPNLPSYFVIDSPAGTDPMALATALREWREVETAYVDPLDASPAPPETNPEYLAQKQTYLKPPATAPRPAPQGAIDAEFAWTQPGGTGAGQKIVDLERGAKLDHVDLVARNIQKLHGENNVNAFDDRRHGTQVLGVVAAVDNAIGVIGIAYGVDEVAYTCQVLVGGAVDRVNAVIAAIQHFTQPGQQAFGRVLLLEVQLNSTIDPLALTDVHGVVWEHMPMETAPADFAVIRLATALGIVVVEAAGNGLHDLDLFQEATGGKFVLSRTHPGDFKDSGAIMVGGATSTYPYIRSVAGPADGTSFGSRVDCFAWADTVHTCDTIPILGDFYSSDFDGTSSAAAIVAGAALLVQGVAQVRLGRRLSPGEIRALLSDPNINTPSANPGVDRIGVMPNLKHILQDALGIAPDVYMRDYVGDTGAVHTGAISLSPDIIVRPAPEPTPGMTFGPGTENDLMLGPTVTAGQDNFVYVRVWNRATLAAAAATNVTATVFYASPATLVTADDWKPVGNPVVIPNVPANNVMTVSTAITWPAVDVPAPGHYCFIALVGNAQDPAPTRANFLNFDYYCAYIRDNNNVTWRNFDVVAAPAPGAPTNLAVDGADPYEFHFAAPGAADSDRYFQLAVGAHLPPGSHVWLEAPLSLLSDRLRFMDVDTMRRTGQVPVGPHGRTTLPSLLFAAKSRSRCRLLVRVPSEYRERDGAVYVSQLYEGLEVGRVTWRIVATE
jgi:serine protease